MCGIIGYSGPRQARDVILDGLERLVYRGYDSSGLALHGPDGLVIRKAVGPVERLVHSLNGYGPDSRSGVGHTRWATHGVPSEVNAHPHVDCAEALAMVHNGIVENADALRAELAARGHLFRTTTDTEVLVHLVEAAPGDTLFERVRGALARVEGTYGLAVIAVDEPGTIVVARRGSPVLLGVGDGEMFVTSDATAIRSYTDSVVYMDEGDMAEVAPDGYRVVDGTGREVERPVTCLEWSAEEADLGGHAHYMMKEIQEQPDSVRRALEGRIDTAAGRTTLDDVDLSAEVCQGIRLVEIVACGTSWHAGLIGRYLIEELARIPVRVEYASEYRYTRRIHEPGTLTIAISQSGETADTLEAIRAADAAGSRLLGLVNVPGSTIARECEDVVPLRAGPEIGVASTKAFTSQIVALVLLAMHLGRQRGVLDPESAATVCREMWSLPGLLGRALGLDSTVRDLAARYARCRGFLYLGRGINFPVALEGALKLKEVSYVYAEGHPAAEMKHGPIALVDENTPVVFVVPRDHLFTKVLSNMAEIKARGGKIIAVCAEGDNGELDGLADHRIPVPCSSHALLTPVTTVVPLQLLAYHIAVLRGCDVDRPRNLAKSVTVE